MRILQILIGFLLLALAAIVVIAVLDKGETSGVPLPPITAGGTPLTADKYTTSKFRPETTFEVGSGWATASPEIADYFDIARERAFNAISFERVQKVSPPEDPSGITRAKAPANLVQWIQTHPRLDAGKPVKASVDGKPATRIDASVKSATTKLKSCLHPCLPLFFPSTGAPVSYEPGDKLRFLFVKVGRKLVTITIAAHGKAFGSFLPQANEVISTLQFAAK
jgi:hypothetical protein